MQAGLTALANPRAPGTDDRELVDELVSLGTHIVDVERLLDPTLFTAYAAYGYTRSARLGFADAVKHRRQPRFVNRPPVPKTPLRNLFARVGRISGSRVSCRSEEMCVSRRSEKGRPTIKVSNLEQRARMAAWVAREVLPHEAAVRVAIGRFRIPPEDVDEVIQEAYCRLSMLDTVDHIDRPGAYFFSIARNLLIRRLKRERVVPIDAIAEIDSYADHQHPSPERQAAGRLDYARMLDFMGRLPERCREIVKLRKIEGWSQKDIAAHLGTTEKAVEKQVWVGVKAIQQAWSDASREAENRLAPPDTERRRR